MKEFKLTKIISSLLIVMSLLMLNPIGIHATEVTNSVQAMDTVINNTESDLTASSTTESAVNVTGIKLDKTSVVIDQGDTLKLKETVFPSTATNKTVTWSSSNTDVAKVSPNGEVEGIAQGTTIITCAANDGSGRNDTCKVTVYYSYYNKLELLNKDESTIKLYSDNNYNNDNIVDEVKNNSTYYAKASSDEISIDVKRLDQKYVKVFKATSYSTLGEVKTTMLVNNGDISLSSGTTTLIVRVYSTKPDSNIKYEDDDNILSEYKVNIELNK